MEKAPKEVQSTNRLVGSNRCDLLARVGTEGRDDDRVRAPPELIIFSRVNVMQVCPSDRETTFPRVRQ